MYELIIPLVIVVITIIIARLVNRVLERSSSFIKEDAKTHYILTKRIIMMAIYFIGFLIAAYNIEYFRSVTTSLLASAGILAIVVGFAAKDVFSNIISGIFIALFKPFRVGDMITYKSQDKITGIVEDINLRHTIIKTCENDRIIVPNINITSTDIINHSIIDERVVRIIEFSISYESDLDLAKKIIKEEILKHNNCLNLKICEAKQIMKDILQPIIEINCSEPLRVEVIELADSCVKLRAWAWSENQQKGYILMCDVLESVKKRFDKEGIEIPYPHTTVVYKNLQGRTL